MSFKLNSGSSTMKEGFGDADTTLNHERETFCDEINNAISGTKRNSSSIQHQTANIDSFF